MGERTKIEWTDATWNPVTGCTQVTEGCDNCYAKTLAEKRLKDVYLARTPVRPDAEAASNPFAVRLWPERLEQPIRWSQPQRIFVNSMSDLFHADIPDSFVREVFEVMFFADHHIYQVLTKRPARMARFVDRQPDLFPAGVPGHIWMGTSIESQKVAFRANHVRKVNAAVRFLSCEPLIGPVDLDLTGIHWVIGGGESGSGHRPCALEWARGLRDICHRSQVAFFWKQWGGNTPKAGGRLLDGVTWDEYPVNLQCAEGKVDASVSSESHTHSTHAVARLPAGET